MRMLNFQCSIEERKNEELIELFDKALSVLKLIILYHSLFSYLNIEN